MEVERKVLSELRVIDLKRELEKRGLDKNGVKAVLMERLSKALLDEGLPPDTHVFELSDGKTPQKGEEAEKTAASEEDKIFDLKDIKVEVIESDSTEDVKNDQQDEHNADSTAPALSIAGSDTEHLEPEDETMITLNETEDGSLLGNEDDDDRGLQDESCSESVTDGNAAKNDEKSDDMDGLSEVKSKVLDNVDKTEESENAGEDENVVSESSRDPEPSANDSNHQQPSSAADDKDKDGKTGGANLWVSNLSPETKATDLKRLFSRHGKLLGAKIVTSARTPGARCYGYVTMANIDDADRCIRFLHRAELHSRLIYVEKAKEDATGPLRNRTRSKERNPSSNRRGAGNREPERKASAPRSKRRSPADATTVDYAKVKEDRERQRQREVERREREAKARREYEEEINARDRERRQRIMAERLEKEKVRLRMEREKLEREKEQLLKLERERQRFERERLEREKEEIRNHKKRLQERPAPPPARSAPKRASSNNDKRTDYPSKRQVLDKDELLLEPPPPPRFTESERQRDNRSRRDDKRPPPRRDDYRQSSPARDRYSRDKIERRSGKDDSRPSSRYDSKTKSHDGKNWPSNGAQYGGYNREVWSSSRQDWPQTDSSSRWPADSQTVSSRSNYSSAVYSGTAYSSHAQPSPPGASVTASHSRYSDPRFDTYAHSLPVRKY